MVEHDARSVANELLQRAWRDKKPITHLKVQKLIYYCQGWMLGLYREPILWQPIEAWEHGPVVRDVYYSLQLHGGGNINIPINVPSEIYNSSQENLIDQVWQVYGKFTTGQLWNLTHEEGAPWHQTWEKWGESAIIPLDFMERYFRSQVESANAENH